MIEFLAANWLWIVLIAAFFAMHRSGMGCGMGHGGQGGHGRNDTDRAEADDRTSSHGTTHPREQVRPGSTGGEGGGKAVTPSRHARPAQSGVTR